MMQLSLLRFLRLAALFGAALSVTIFCGGLITSSQAAIYAGLLFASLGLMIARGCKSLLDTGVEIFNPTIIFVYFFVFFHLLEPLLDFSLYGIPASSYPYFIAGVWSTFCGILAFETAMSLYNPRPLAIPQHMHLDRGILVLIPLVLLGISGSTTMVGFGGAQFGYLIALLGMLISLRIETRAGRLYSALLVPGAISISLDEFTRAYLGQVLLIVILYVHFFYWRVRLWMAALLGVLMFPLMVILAFARAARHKIRSASEDEGIISILSNIATQASEYIDQIYASIDKSSIYLMTLNIDFPWAYEAYLNIVNYVPRYVEYTWGFSYYRWLFVLIPRSLWPEKPENLSAQYIYSFVDPGWHGHSSAILLLGEFHWNFGLPGIIIGMFMTGLLIRLLQNTMQSCIGNPFAFAMFATILLVIPQLMRGVTDVVMLYAILWKFLPLALIFFLLNAAPRLFRTLVANARTRRGQIRRQTG